MSLYPRRSGRSEDQETRHRAEAHRILDMARAGQPISEDRITWALRITGDLT